MRPHPRTLSPSLNSRWHPCPPTASISILYVPKVPSFSLSRCASQEQTRLAFCDCHRPVAVRLDNIVAPFVLAVASDELDTTAGHRLPEEVHTGRRVEPRGRRRTVEQKRVSTVQAGQST